MLSEVGPGSLLQQVSFVKWLTLSAVVGPKSLIWVYIIIYKPYEILGYFQTEFTKTLTMGFGWTIQQINEPKPYRMSQ